MLFCSFQTSIVIVICRKIVMLCCIIGIDFDGRFYVDGVEISNVMLNVFIFILALFLTHEIVLENMHYFYFCPIH